MNKGKLIHSKYSLILGAFKLDKKAQKWFNLPQDKLDGKTPFEILSADEPSGSDIDFLYSCFESGLFFNTPNRNVIPLSEVEFAFLAEN